MFFCNYLYFTPIFNKSYLPSDVRSGNVINGQLLNKAVAECLGVEHNEMEDFNNRAVSA